MDENANGFRSRLKVWMEAARTEPVKITRKSGEAFVLVNADTFEKMQIDLARLEGLAAGLLDAAQGRTKTSTEKSTSTVLVRAESRALNLRRI